MENTIEPPFQNLSTSTVNKSVLVIGGAGYIGSHIAKHLLRNGYTPVIVGRDIKNSPITKIIDDCFEMDLPRDLHLLDEISKRYNIDSCIHTAAYTAVGESVANPDRYYKNNVIMTVQLLNKLKDLGIKKVLFSSSAAVYGIPADGICRDTETNLQPINPYGQTKLICEKILQDYYRAYGIQSVSFRFFNAAGADPEGDIGECHAVETHIIPICIRAGFQVEQFKIFGKNLNTPDGTCVRDYVHVQDIADAHVRALNLLGKTIQCESLNIGSGVGVSNLQIVKEVARHTGAMDLFMDDRRPGDPDQLVADISRTKELLNWKPEHSSIDNIVRSAVQWYKQTNKKEIN